MRQFITKKDYVPELKAFVHFNPYLYNKMRIKHSISAHKLRQFFNIDSVEVLYVYY